MVILTLRSGAFIGIADKRLTTLDWHRMMLVLRIIMRLKMRSAGVILMLHNGS
jgi:hypothetical protein